MDLKLVPCAMDEGWQSVAKSNRTRNSSRQIAFATRSSMCAAHEDCAIFVWLRFQPTCVLYIHIWDPCSSANEFPSLLFADTFHALIKILRKKNKTLGVMCSPSFPPLDSFSICFFNEMLNRGEIPFCMHIFSMASSMMIYVHKWIFKTIKCLFFHKNPFSVRAVAEFKRTKLSFVRWRRKLHHFASVSIFSRTKSRTSTTSTPSVFVSFFAFELLAIARWRLAHQHNEHRSRFVFTA